MLASGSHSVTMSKEKGCAGTLAMVSVPSDSTYSPGQRSLPSRAMRSSVSASPSSTSGFPPAAALGFGRMLSREATRAAFGAKLTSSATSSMR